HKRERFLGGMLPGNSLFGLLHHSIPVVVKHPRRAIVRTPRQLAIGLRARRDDLTTLVPNQPPAVARNDSRPKEFGAPPRAHVADQTPRHSRAPAEIPSRPL